MNVVFVISDLHLGGAVMSTRLMGQALIEAGVSVSLLCLGARPEAAWSRFAALGAKTASSSDLADADLVIVFFWNTPAMHRFINSSHPPMRVVLRPNIEGGCPPHVITKEVAGFADAVWSSASSTLAISELSAVPRRYLRPSRDLSPFRPRPGCARKGFVAGYLGTVDFVKMHPDYVAMSAAAGDDLTFDVWGGGRAGSSIMEEAGRLGRSSQFHVRGVTHEPAVVLAGFDIFGYPLCADNYAANDSALLEAMATGLPSVVFDNPGNRDLVKDGETALVARTAAEYSGALAALREDRDLRSRIGANAAEFARKLQSNKSQDDLFAALSDVMAMPKRRRDASELADKTGADLFVRSLGRFAGAFSRNLVDLRTGVGKPLQESELEIAASSPGMCNPGAGGLYCYRAAFPDDPVLRYWSGLVFAFSGRPAVALAEFLAARRRGIGAETVMGHIERASKACAEQQPARRTASLASDLPGLVS